MKKVSKSSKKGFTLVELIVVLVILAILAAMLVPALTGYIRRAREEKEYQTAATVYSAAQAVITDGYGRSNSDILLGSAATTGTISKDKVKVGTGSTAVDAVLDLASVTANSVAGYSFNYDKNYVITGGWVHIGDSYYVLTINTTTGVPTWSAQSSQPAAAT